MTTTPRRSMGRWARALLCLGVLAAAAPASARPVGVAAAVQPPATGTPAQGDARLLRVGVDVVAGERIATGPAGKTHLLFNDGSALSIGANADVVLDEVAYDAAMRTGRIALSASKGVLRLVGGRISKTAPVRVRTPTATVDIQGGIAILAVDAAATTATFLFGDRLTVSAGGRTTTLTRPGFQVMVPAGGRPAAPQPIPPGVLAGIVGDLEGAPPSGGAAAPVVTDADIAGSQLGTLGSANPPARIGLIDVARAPVVDPIAVDAAREAVERQDESRIDTFAAGSAGAAALVAAGFVDQGNGVFTFAGSTADAQVALQQLAGSLRGSVAATSGSSRFFSGVDFFATSNVTTLLSPTIACGTGFQCVSIIGGRAKAGASTGTGTNAFNQALDGTSVVGASTFTFNTTAGTFVLPRPATGGTFAVTGATLPASLGGGPFTGTGFATPALDFVLYELTGSQILVFVGQANAGIGAGTSFLAAPYSLRDDFTLGGSQVPFVPMPLQTNIASTISPTMTVLLSTPVGGDRFFVAGNLLIDGTGASQGIAGSLLVGLSRGGDSGTPMFLSGLMRGTADAGTVGFAPRRFAGPVGTADDALGFDFFGQDAPRFTVLEAASVNDSDIDQGGGGIQQFAGTGATGGSIFPNVPALNTASDLGVFTATSGAGNSQRTSRMLSGYAGGVAVERNAVNTIVDIDTFRSNTSPSPSVFSRVQISTDAVSNRVTATMNLASDTDGFGIGGATVLGFGGLSTAGRSAFLNNSTFAAVESTGGQTVDGNAGTVSGLLVTRNMVTFAGGALPGGVTLCTCNELQWGFFAATLANPGSASYDIPLAQWVAGTPAAAAQVAGFTGTATYSGHVAASVLSGASANPAATQRYTALGSMLMQLSFSGGTVSVNGGNLSLDGSTYTLTPGSALTAPEFAFNLSNGTDRSGNGTGALFGSGAPPGQAGGHFSLAQGGVGNASASYAAAGIFATDRTAP